MRLGEMLVRDGHLDMPKLDQVIQRQSQEGGRIGSLLVAEGLVDAETLTVYLGMELGIPIANWATFERCKRSAVLVLSPQQAAHFHCVPIVIQGQTLIVAVDSPHDMRNLDEIGQATGYRIIPRVAPEIYIYHFLEHFYGVPKTPLFVRLAEEINSHPAPVPSGELPGPSLPGLPPRKSTATAHSGTQASRRIRRMSETVTQKQSENFDYDEHEALELDAADLIEELEADDEELAPEAEPSNQQARAHSPSTSTSMAPEPIDYEQALKIISETNRRGDIADAILRHAAKLFEVSALLLVRDNIAFGWKGFGPHLDSSRIETILVPLDYNSMFSIALEEKESFRGRPRACSLHTHWYRILQCDEPDSAAVFVCKIGKRIVNMLYGHTADGKKLSDEEMENMRDLMEAASDSYVRLISKSKTKNPK